MKIKEVYELEIDKNNRAIYQHFRTFFRKDDTVHRIQEIRKIYILPTTLKRIKQHYARRKSHFGNHQYRRQILGSTAFRHMPTLQQVLP